MDFLQTYLPHIHREINQIQLPDYPKSLYQPQRYLFENSGKMVRPVLTLMGCGMCGGSIRDALPVAVACELIHTFTLVHDDIMDHADNRRGKPTVHKKWNEATAILAGDGMFVQAMLQLQKIPVHVDHKRVSNVFLNGINRVCEGQALDMEFEERTDVNTDDYLEMVKGKTAALISTSLQLGGLSANAEKEQLICLNDIGMALGVAFQLQDDWLDVTADPKKFGKKRGGDISKGKKTYLMLRALEQCSEKDKNDILREISTLNVSEKTVAKVITMFEKSGIITESEQLFKKYYSQAEDTANEFGDSSFKRDLINLINFLKNREY